MTRRRTVKLNIGAQRMPSGSPGNPAGPNYVQNMLAQSKSLTDNILAVINQFKDATPDIIYEALEPTLELSLVYCPIDTGALRASAYLEITEFRGKPRVELGYARGSDPEYAVAVHENLEWRHEPPTRSKFLQAAVDEDIGNIEARLIAAYQEMVDGQ